MELKPIRSEKASGWPGLDPYVTIKKPKAPRKRRTEELTAA